jgi:tRNA pseudouridine38-40 synthase
MVRSIVGTLIQVGRNRRFPEDIPKILAARDRSLAGATAAAKGLCLERIYFEEPHKDWFERLRDQSLR